MTSPELPVDPLAVSMTRLEGKVDLSNERHQNVQLAIEKLETAMRDDRISGEQRMKQHVDSPNPHPQQEAWLRELHAGHEGRLKTLETSSAATRGRDGAIKWLLGVALTEGATLLGVLFSYLSSRHH